MPDDLPILFDFPSNPEAALVEGQGGERELPVAAGQHSDELVVARATLHVWHRPAVGLSEPRLAHP